MNVMVTGGRGYMGKFIVTKLIEEGHTVINYCRDMQLPNKEKENVFVLGDLTDIPRLISVIKEYKVDRIIHTAGQSHPGLSTIIPFGTVESNIMGTLGVLEAARMSGIKRVVLFSSECAYGEQGYEEIKLENPLIPRTPYGVTKAANEMFGRAYNWTFGMDCVSLRVGQVYGPMHVTQEYVRDAIKAAIRGEKYILDRGLDQRIQLIYIEDAAEVSVRACFAEKINEMAVYNATSGYQPTFGEILEVIREFIPEAEFEVGPGNFGTEKQGIFDISDTIKDLEYEPKVSLREGIQKYIEWLKENEL